MKDTVTVLAVIAALAGLSSSVYSHRVERPRALATLAQAHAAELAAERQRHAALEGQLAQAQADQRDLAASLAEARADRAAAETRLAEAQAAAAAAAAGVSTAPVPAPGSAVAAVPLAPAPPAPRPDPAAAQREAQIRRLTEQLAAYQTRREQVAAWDPGFAEQRINPETGRKSGIRTSDADRAKVEAQRAAELRRLDAAIATLQRDLAALTAGTPQP